MGSNPILSAKNLVRNFRAQFFVHLNRLRKQAFYFVALYICSVLSYSITSLGMRKRCIKEVDVKKIMIAGGPVHANLNEQYPDHERYKALYARYYLGRPVQQLLDLLEPLNGQRVMDLCAGDGQVALGAIARGASEAAIVDHSSDMVPESARNHQKVFVYTSSVENFLSYAYVAGPTYDRAICRQGVNYWLNEDTATNLFLALNPGGVFVFNTFHQKPPEKPRVMEYPLDGHMFVETSWSVGDIVHHVQIRSGMEPHYTKFHWLSPERLRSMLEPNFIVREERIGGTSLYRCEKR